MILKFSRIVKTSRKLIFENIMDLDHVCHLHARWFSNLRVIIQRSDYVEYRLTSSFFGLKQEVLAKGGPIDENRYWYEFNGRITQVRVDGYMEGPDGELLQTETITYKYKWFFAPFFWILKPCFNIQKNDIFEADSAALERMYKLEQEGFQRNEISRSRIVVYGGSGFFGRLVVQDLLEHSKAEIIIASRNPTSISFNAKDPTRIKYFISNIEDLDSIKRTIHGAQVVVCCVGPFQGMSLNLFNACIEKNIHYVDVADDRDFLLSTYNLADKVNKSGIKAFIGCSVIPGISTLLASYSTQGIKEIDNIKICITPGTRYARGPGSFECLLSTLGNPIKIPFNGSTKTVLGWTGKETVLFPEPINKRQVYFVVDTPDYYLQPLYFGAQTVQFKIGAEFVFLNKSLALMNALKKSLRLKSLKSMIPLFRKVIGFAGLFGTTQGGMLVEIQNHREPDKKIGYSVATDKNGEKIPAILPSLAVLRILNNQVTETGIVNLSNWIEQDEFIREFKKRGIQVFEYSSDGLWKEKVITVETNQNQSNTIKT